jgi:alanyl-tRNA synthetase
VIKEHLVSANETIEIIDTKKENNLILHFAKLLPENIRSSGFVAKANTDLRTSTSKNHSATHLMHLALRSISGNSRGAKRIIGESELSAF